MLVIPVMEHKPPSDSYLDHKPVVSNLDARASMRVCCPRDAQWFPSSDVQWFLSVIHKRPLKVLPA